MITQPTTEELEMLNHWSDKLGLGSYEDYINHIIYVHKLEADRYTRTTGV